MSWKKVVGIIAATLGTAFVTTAVVAKVKKIIASIKMSRTRRTRWRVKK